MKSKLLIALFAIVACLTMKDYQRWKSSTIASWDKAGYYIYLPALFIYNDLSGLHFSPTIAEKYHPQGDIKWYFLYAYPEGKRLNKYTLGVALFEAPFFICAHLFASFTHHYPTDGYSVPYQLAIAFSTIFWVVLGLFVLRKFLLYYYNENVVFCTLCCIAFGTNLYYYTAFDQGMSHPYSFFLFACVLYFTHNIYNNYKRKYLFLLSVVLGLITLVRPINIIIIIIPLFWGVYNLKSLQYRLTFFWKVLPDILIAFIPFCLILLIQMQYWHLITGKWLHFSYEGEGFNFAHPKIWRGLFSYRKGWFVYTPIALVSFGGFYLVWKNYRGYFAALLLFFVVMIYIVFSWRLWYYGGSFGCRPLIETLAVSSFILAALIDRILLLKGPVIKSIFFIAFSGLIALNIFQSRQYSLSVIHWDRMTKAYYWRVFGKLHSTPEDDKYLLQGQEYTKEEEECYK